MTDKIEQTVDLLISHGQIVIRSRDFNEELSQWGKGNLAQGAILHNDYIVFDPLPEDAFGAKVIILRKPPALPGEYLLFEFPTNS